MIFVHVIILQMTGFINIFRMDGGQDEKHTTFQLKWVPFSKTSLCIFTAFFNMKMLKLLEK